MFLDIVFLSISYWVVWVYISFSPVFSLGVGFFMCLLGFWLGVCGGGLFVVCVGLLGVWFSSGGLFVLFVWGVLWGGLGLFGIWGFMRFLKVGCVNM